LECNDLSIARADMPEQTKARPEARKPNRAGRQFKIYFEPAEYERLKGFCEATGRIMTVVARRAISDYLDRLERAGK
jgi:hypothetical protein